MTDSTYFVKSTPPRVFSGLGEGCFRFWGRLDQNCGCHVNQKLQLTYNGENGISVIFYRIFAKLADIQDRHKISDEFKFQLDWIIHFSVTRLSLSTGNISH